MFKSKAQKEAEHRLKVEQEMERIRQRKEAAQQQGEAIKEWFNGLPPENRNLLLTGIAGLFTGGLAGAILSPIAFHQYSKRINSSAMKWLAWAGTGLIAAPILIGIQTAMFGEPETQSITAKNEVTQVEEVQPVASAQKPTPMPSVEATPATASTPKPLTPEEKFAQTLTSKTDGIFAIEAVSILAPHYYENRHELWRAISGISPSESEYLVAEALKQQALTNDLPWDDAQIQKMSKGIVAGLYKWNLENPGDL